MQIDTQEVAGSTVPQGIVIGSFLMVGFFVSMAIISCGMVSELEAGEF